MTTSIASRARLARTWIALAVALGLLAPAILLAHPDGSTEDLKAQIRELDEKLRVLEERLDRQAQQQAEAQRAAPLIFAGADGFKVQSRDTNFVLRARGVLQADSRSFFNQGPDRGNDSFLLRRARPILQGTVFGDFDFLFVPDFGGSMPQIFDAYLNYRYEPELQVRVGKFKSPVGLEQLVEDVNLLFNERTLVTDLVPNRDLGVQLHGQVFDTKLTYALGIFNGIGDARNSSNADFEDDKDIEGRLFLQPFAGGGARPLRGIGFGVGGSYGSVHTAAALPATTGGTLPGYTTDGQQQFFAYNPGGGATVLADGVHWRLSPQASYYWGPLGLFGEYIVSSQAVRRTGAAPLASANLAATAWEITGSWLLTGEDASSSGVVPRRPFRLTEGSWGAWQVVARVAGLEVDKAAFPLFADPTLSARAAASWSVGLNWWLNRNVRVL
ncbi:MAG: porin, partial [Verrucomicrobia bacterium]|nr:porin [Verrucomicrobiota bacterium]